MPESVYIIFSGEDPLDERFASLLAKDIESFATAKLIVAEEFVQFSMNWLQRGVGYPGISVFILSRSMVSTSERRNTLSQSLRFRDNSLYHHYYICRGASAITLLKEHPDLSTLYEGVTVVDEANYPELLADLKEYSSHLLPAILERVTLGRTIRNTARILLSTILETASRLTTFIYFLSYFGALILSLLLVFGWNARWIPLLTLGCLYGAGYRLNQIVPVDLWPWLGPRWIISKSVARRVLETELKKRPRFGAIELIVIGIGSWVAQRVGNVIPIAIALAFATITQAAINQWYQEKTRGLVKLIPPDDESVAAPTTTGPVCSENCLREAFSHCFQFGWMSLRNSIFWLSVLLLPILILLTTRSSLNYHLAGCAFLIGLFTPVVSDWAHRTYEYNLVLMRGLTDEYLLAKEKLTQRFDIKPLPFLSCVDEDDLSHFDDAERKTITRWITLATFPCSPLTVRSWKTPRDYVFISYAWADDSETRMSSQLASMFDSLNINYFLDKRVLDSKFRSWRPAVAEGVWKSTHLFLVVSPNITSGAVIQKELSAAFYRWYFELMPAIVCVVEPDVAQRLREDKQVPLNLRFVLTWCPQLTFAQASDPNLVKFLLSQRRRQGRFKDWCTVLAFRMAKLKLIAGYFG